MDAAIHATHDVANTFPTRGGLTTQHDPSMISPAGTLPGVPDPQSKEVASREPPPPSLARRETQPLTVATMRELARKAHPHTARHEPRRQQGRPRHPHTMVWAALEKVWKIGHVAASAA